MSPLRLMSEPVVSISSWQEFDLNLMVGCNIIFRWLANIRCNRFLYPHLNRVTIDPMSRETLK